MTPRELATVLAALRYWQNAQDVPLDIYDIATEAGEPLTYTEIDDLCERLNT